MAAEISPGSAVRRVRRLGGGLATETFAVDLAGVNPCKLVVKRYRDGDETSQSEWERLHFAERVAIPVPEPVALDTRGAWFGVPALVMTRLAGRVDVTPANVDGWLHQLALAMAAIHDTDATGAAGALLDAPYVQSLEAWSVARPSSLVERARQTIDRLLPRVAWRPVLIHGDFHPGNVIWTRGIVSGVTDWSDSRLGPRWYEVAYCRADVAVLLGTAAADRLTRHYVTITGQQPVDLALFDLICGLRARESAASWLTAYREQGRTDTPRQFASRVTPFLRQALAQLNT